MNSIAIESNQPFQSRFVPDPDEKKEIPDRDTLEGLANLMGVDIAEIEAKIAEQEQIQRAAWKKKKTRKAQHASSVTQFIEVVNFQGKQLFWSIGGQQFVVGAHGQIFPESSMRDALHRLACE